MAHFVQSDFSGGMDLLTTDTELAVNCYRYLINGRPRYGAIEPIRDSILIDSPRGKKQGLITVGSIKVLFCEGKAYYRLIDGNSWIRIANFAMDSSVEYIYAHAAVSSSLNNKRILNVDNNRAGLVNVAADFTIAGTPAGLLCQDGINQPWVIFYDALNNQASARLAKDYSEWSNDGNTADSREYVPIGSLMFDYSGILFILAQDGFTWLRSVSGRMLDFMVNIDKDGNKLATEELGGAVSTSFSVGFDQCTFIGPLDAGHFLIGTIRNQYAISLNFTNTVFGEPTFDTPIFLTTGIRNQFSQASVNGDSAFIDFDGVRTFNGTRNFRFSGRNDPFSLKISGILIDKVTLKPIRQPDTVCCVEFNNYTIFSLKTSLGQILAVCDTLLIDQNNINGKWVSFDITACVGVKQFAITNTLDESLLFAITTDDKVYQLFGSANRATAQYKSGSFVNNTADATHKTRNIYPIFEKSVDNGYCFVQELVDDMRGQYKRLPISGVVCAIVPPVMPPVTPNNKKLIDDKLFALDQGQSGYKISTIISWDTAARLTLMDLETDARTQDVPKEQQTTIFS